MSESHASARPRPVADAPVAELEARAEDLTKRWLVALLEAAPLQQSAQLALDELARGGPSLCAAIVRALRSDDELARLEPSGDLRPLAESAARLAGAGDPIAAIAAVEALRRAIWGLTAVLLPGASAPRLADTADRLAYVCSLLAGAAATAAIRGEAPAAPEAEAMSAPARGQRDISAPPPRQAAMSAQPPPVASPPEAPFEPSAPPPPLLQPATPAAGNGAPHPITPPEDAPAAVWLGAIGTQLERYAVDRQPFAVLTVEVEDIDRLHYADTNGALVRAIDAVERAVGSVLRPADTIMRERRGRYWLVAPDTDSSGADVLARRIASSVPPDAVHRGARLRLSVGVATCPTNGADAVALAARADVSMFAARSAGLSVAPASFASGRH